jgi:hypothetical protein
MLGISLGIGCAVLQVRQGILEGNIVYSSLVPELQVKVSDELKYVDQEDRHHWVAIEHNPTGSEPTRSELFRFEGGDAKSGLLVTLAHAPMDMMLVPGFGFDFLNRSLEHGSHEDAGRTVHSAVLRDGEFLFAKFTLLLQGSGRTRMTIDYWEPLAAGDQALFRDRKSPSAREKEMIDGFQARAREKFSLVKASSAQGLRSRPETPYDRPIAGRVPQPPSDPPVASPTPMVDSLGR